MTEKKTCQILIYEIYKKKAHNWNGVCPICLSKGNSLFRHEFDNAHEKCLRLFAKAAENGAPG